MRKASSIYQTLPSEIGTVLRGHAHSTSLHVRFMQTLSSAARANYKPTSTSPTGISHYRHLSTDSRVERINPKDAILLPGWSEEIAAQVPLFYKALKKMTRKTINEEAHLPTLKPDTRRTVFTHHSVYTNPRAHVKTSLESSFPRKGYEVFETLGDASLQSIVSGLIANKFPHVHTGGITSMRSYLVRNSTLAHFSRLYDLPANLRISPTNYTAASIKDNYSTAADVLEAYVWGVQLDHGFPRCQRWVNGLYKTLLDPLYQDLGGKGEFHMSPAQQFRWLDKHDMQGRSAH